MTPIALDKPGVVKLAALPPLSLYVHIPWCVRKCPYCDFNSHERVGELPQAQYTERLLRDLEEMLPSVWGRRIGSIFIGGGSKVVEQLREIDPLALKADQETQAEGDEELEEGVRDHGAIVPLPPLRHNTTCQV